MEKIKCVVSENGTIIPIHNIAIISAEDSSHYIWTNANSDLADKGYKLSNEKYNALLRELEYIGGKHFQLKAGHWYICHRAYCCRADNLTVKEGERFKCEEDCVVKGFVIKEPEKYFKEVCAPAPMEDEQKPVWGEEDERNLNDAILFIETGTYSLDKDNLINWLKSLKDRVQR